jgi:protease I
MSKKIGILLENRFIDKEIIYYSERFKEAGFEPVFLTRLWGMDELTFRGMELGLEVKVNQSFENLTDEKLKDFAAVIVPAGYVADYLLYSDKPKVKSPAVEFVEKLMGKPEIIKGFICHSLWIAGPLKDVFAGRNVTCHNNIISHVENAGMNYNDKDIFVDKDLITARTGGDFAAFAAEIIKNISD